MGMPHLWKMAVGGTAGRDVEKIGVELHLVVEGVGPPPLYANRIKAMGELRKQELKERKLILWQEMQQILEDRVAAVATLEVAPAEVGD